jgi:transposase
MADDDYMVPFGHDPGLAGLIDPGNIDLSNRPRVRNPDGSISTVRSKSFNFDGREVLLPTVSDDGRILDDRDAIDLYRRTGRHLGTFDTPEAATSYAERLHQSQERTYAQPRQPAARPVYLLPVDHDPFKPGTQTGEDEEAAAFAGMADVPRTSSSLAGFRPPVPGGATMFGLPDLVDRHGDGPGTFDLATGQRVPDAVPPTYMQRLGTHLRSKFDPVRQWEILSAYYRAARLADKDRNSASESSDGGDLSSPISRRLPGETGRPGNTALVGAPQEDIEARAFADRTGFEHIPFAHAAIGGAAMMTALPRIAHNAISEGINTSVDWLRATHQMDGAKATDLFVRPREGDNADIIDNPNSVNKSAPLSPLGLASMGNPVSALGRESLRAGAKVGRPSESYSPSLGDRAIAKYMEIRDRNKFDAGESIIGEDAAKGIREIQSFDPSFAPTDFQARHGRYFEPGKYDLRTADELATGAKGALRPDNDKYPDYVRLLSDAGKRSSLPGMIANSGEKPTAGTTPLNERGYRLEAGRQGLAEPAPYIERGDRNSPLVVSRNPGSDKDIADQALRATQGDWDKAMELVKDNPGAVYALNWWKESGANFRPHQDPVRSQDYWRGLDEFNLAQAPSRLMADQQRGSLPGMIGEVLDKRRVEFTPEMKAAFKDGYLEGASLFDLADSIGIGSATLQRRAPELIKEMGLPTLRGRQAFWSENRAAFEADYHSGLPWADLAKKYDLAGADSVANVVKRFGLPPRQKSHGEDLLNKVRDMRAAGTSYQEIANELGTTKNAIAGIIDRMRKGGTEVYADQQRASLPGMIGNLLDHGGQVSSARLSPEARQEFRQTFKELYEAGEPLESIAQRLGVDPRDLKTNQSRLLLGEEEAARGGFIRGREAEFSKMWNAGVPRSEIADHFGVAPKTISNTRMTLGLGPRPGTIKNEAELLDEVRALRFEGHSQSEVADKLGITTGKVAGIIRRMRAGGTTVLSDQQRASLPGMIQGAVENASRGGAVTPASGILASELEQRVGRTLPDSVVDRLNPMLESAKKLGFDTSQILYHGSDNEFPAFRRDRSDINEISGNFFTPRKMEAEGYGANVGTYVVRAQKPLELEMVKGGWRARSSHDAEAIRRAGIDLNEPDFAMSGNRLTEALERLGYDAAKLYSGDKHAWTVVFDPKNIRSTNAAFDPAKTGSANLLGADQQRGSTVGAIAGAVENASRSEKVTPATAQEYLKAGTLREADAVSEAMMPLSKFNGTDIRASQTTVDPKGVSKYRKRIEAGERPAVLLEETEPGKYRIVDGHTKATAYHQLGIEDVPVLLRGRGDRSSGAANASESLNPKAVKDLYARQGMPLPSNDGALDEDAIRNSYSDYDLGYGRQPIDPDYQEWRKRAVDERYAEDVKTVEVARAMHALAGYRPGQRLSTNVEDRRLDGDHQSTAEQTGEDGPSYAENYGPLPGPRRIYLVPVDHNPFNRKGRQLTRRAF